MTTNGHQHVSELFNSVRPLENIKNSLGSFGTIILKVYTNTEYSTQSDISCRHQLFSLKGEDE